MQGFRLAVLALTAAVSSAFHNVLFRLVKPQYMLLRSTNRAGTASDIISKRLLCFWKAVCEGAVRRVNVTISGEEFVGCVLPTAPTGLSPNWGVTGGFTSPVILERPDYVRAAEVYLGPGRPNVALLEGTKGIGKSVFIPWLMYHIMHRNKTGKPTVIVSDEYANYWFHYDADGEPAVDVFSVESWRVPVADYVLSASKYRLFPPAEQLELFVAGDGRMATEAYRMLHDADEQSRPVNEFTMSTCSRAEVRAIFHVLQLDEEGVEFAFTVFGGNVRLCVALASTVSTMRRTGTPPRRTAGEALDWAVKAMVECTAGTDFADNRFQDWRHCAVAIVSNKLNLLTCGADMAAEVRSSLLEHMRVVDNKVKRGYASVYASHLIEVALVASTGALQGHLRSALQGTGFMTPAKLDAGTTQRRLRR
jgi:hypothetical protein